MSNPSDPSSKPFSPSKEIRFFFLSIRRNQITLLPIQGSRALSSLLDIDRQPSLPCIPSCHAWTGSPSSMPPCACFILFPQTSHPLELPWTPHTLLLFLHFATEKTLSRHPKSSANLLSKHSLKHHCSPHISSLSRSRPSAGGILAPSSPHENTCKHLDHPHSSLLFLIFGREPHQEHQLWCNFLPLTLDYLVFSLKIIKVRPLKGASTAHITPKPIANSP